MAAPPAAWSSARGPRRRRQPSPTGLPGEGVVASIARVPPAGLTVDGPPPPPPPALLSTVIRPTPAGGGRAERALATLPPFAKAHVAAAIEPGVGLANASPTRAAAALARLLASHPAVFGPSAGGPGGGEVAGYDAHTEAAVRTALAAAVVEAMEGGGGAPPGPASVAVIVPGQGVYAATSAPAPAARPPAGGPSPLPPPAPLITVFDLAGALIAYLPHPGAPRHVLPPTDGAPLPFVTQSGHAALPDDRAAVVCVASPAAGPDTPGLRPPGVAKELGRRLWGVVTPDAASVGEAGREALSMAWADAGNHATVPPALSASILLHAAANAITGEEEMEEGGLYSDGDGEEPEGVDPFAEEFGGGPPDLKDFAGEQAPAWWE